MSAAPQEAPLLPGKLRNARALWLVLIIMAFLAGCALLFARGSLRLSGDWQSQLSNTLTVQVMLDSSDRWAEQTDLARTTLSNTFPSADIELLSQDDAMDLLKPWLGNATLPESLPIPGLLNVVGEGLSITDAQSALDAAGLSTNIDDNTRYADSLSGTTRRLVSISLGTLLLVVHRQTLCHTSPPTRRNWSANRIRLSRNILDWSVNLWGLGRSGMDRSGCWSL